MGRDKKVRGAAVVVSSTGNSRGSTGARRRPRRRSGPSRPRPRSPPKRVSRCRPRGCRRSASARRPPRGAARARSAPHRLRSRPGGRADREESMIGFCLCTTFSLYSVRSARFQTACSLGYYTVFSDSKKRPLERHNSALASRRLDCQSSATLSAKRSKGPARQNQEAWSPCVIPLGVALTPVRAPAPARGADRRRSGARRRT